MLTHHHISTSWYNTVGKSLEGNYCANVWLPCIKTSSPTGHPWLLMCKFVPNPWNQVSDWTFVWLYTFHTQSSYPRFFTVPVLKPHHAQCLIFTPSLYTGLFVFVFATPEGLTTMEANKNLEKDVV